MSEHTNTDHMTTLVLGGTGKTGRRVVERLRSRGVPTRVGSRSGVLPFDWDDGATWSPVLSGVTAVYVSFYPDLAVPGAAATVGAFAELAAEHDVRRLVLLSGRGEEEAQRTEQAVLATVPGATVVRSSWFSQNFSESFMAEGVADAVLALPVGSVPEPFVDAEDIADVAVAALTQAGHAGRVYEATGPRLLTFAEALEEIARATGRELRFEPVPMDHYAAFLREQGVPADEVALLTYLFTEVLDGRNANMTDGIQQALGRPPRDFGGYAKTTAASGAWNRTPERAR